MTYKIISAIIRDNLRFDTLPIIKANVLYDIKSPADNHQQKYPGLLMYFYSESKLLSISSFNWFLFIVPNFIVGLPFSGQSNRLGMVRILNALSNSGS